MNAMIVSMCCPECEKNLRYQLSSEVHTIARLNHAVCYASLALLLFLWHLQLFACVTCVYYLKLCLYM